LCDQIFDGLIKNLIPNIFDEEVRTHTIKMGNSQSDYTELIKESVTGYKALSSDFSCRGFKYEVGQTYEMPAGKKIKLGRVGFHFCRLPYNCKKYYPISRSDTTRYAKVEAWDSIHTKNNSVARKIRIIEEITFEQFKCLTGTFVTTDRTIVYYIEKTIYQQLNMSMGTKDTL
jgi:hypothetical protein